MAKRKSSGKTTSRRNTARPETGGTSKEADAADQTGTPDAPDAAAQEAATDRATADAEGPDAPEAAATPSPETADAGGGEQGPGADEPSPPKDDAPEQPPSAAPETPAGAEAPDTAETTARDMPAVSEEGTTAAEDAPGEDPVAAAAPAAEAGAEDAAPDGHATETPETASDADSAAPVTAEGAASDRTGDDDAPTTIPATGSGRDRADTRDEPGPGQEPPAGGARDPEPVVIRKGGALSMVFGGVIAAAIGFGGGYYYSFEYLGRSYDPAALETLREDMQSRLESLRTETKAAVQDQSDRISALSRDIEAIEPADPPDLSGLRTAQEEIQATVSTLSERMAQTEDRVASLRQRLTELEQRPVTEGASQEAIAAYEAELQALQDAMAQQRAEIEEMTAEAQQMEQNAEQQARATRRRAALARIRTALDTGNGFAAALAELEAAGGSAPGPLSAVAEDGVPTLSELQDSFPDAARAALAAARDAAARSGETGSLTAFLRNQLGARSLEPRAGDDPDAILSRAGAALREGRLSAALAEIGDLPDVARAELDGWAERARQRLQAVAAARQLSEESN